MSHIYREKREIPIPEGAYINRHDGRVFVFLNSDNIPKRDCKRMNIGKAASATTMYVNENFRFYYPQLWEQHYGESDNNDKMKHILHPGMYALTLGIAYHNSLYPLLLDVFGPSAANQIVDYSMYSIMEHSNVTLGYQDRMSSEVLFSHTGAVSDSTLSAFFAGKITDEQSYEFRSKWIDSCVKNGVTKVWICIDGSNNDCLSQSCALASKGEAKSMKNVNIVGYMYAVCAETGLPLTYDVYHGNTVDSQAFHKIIELLNAHHIEILGIIIDRGFATDKVLDHIRSLKFPFVVMLKSDSFGFTDMLEKHWNTIKVKVDHLVNNNGIFGISEQHRIFKNSPDDDYVSLYYDMNNGTARSFALINKVLSAKIKMEKELREGQKPKVPKEMSKYFEIVTGPDKKYQIVCNYEVWQHDVDMKGFAAIGSSENFGPAETDRIYNLRNSSEVQYSFIKTQLGSDVSRVHTTDSILNKFTVCFVSSIIRNEIQQNCKSLGLTTNSAISEIDRIEMLLQPNRNYIAIHNETKRAKLLLNRFDIIPEDFDAIAAEVTSRFTSPIQSLERKKPEHKKKSAVNENDKPSETAGGQEGSTAGQNIGKKDTSSSSGKKVSKSDKAKRGPGRPKVSKNKRTLRIEQLIEEGKLEPPVKGKPGRPKGSKNKPKKPLSERVKRGPGRPKGSRNKPRPDISLL